MKGVLLNNLGSPDSTDLKDVKTYLDEFLMDERVIDIPYWKRYILIKGIISILFIEHIYFCSSHGICIAKPCGQ